MLGQQKEANMPKVFVIQRSYREKDLSSAARYGEIHFVLNDSKVQPSSQPGRVQQPIENAMRDFNVEEDYLLGLGGDWAGPLIVGSVLSRMYPGKEIKILRWERERSISGERLPGAGFYTPSVIRV